jgi:hypothetical protein
MSTRSADRTGWTDLHEPFCDLDFHAAATGCLLSLDSNSMVLLCSHTDFRPLLGGGREGMRS